MPAQAAKLSRQFAVRFCGRSGEVSSMRDASATRSRRDSREARSIAMISMVARASSASCFEIFINADFRHYLKSGPRYFRVLTLAFISLSRRLWSRLESRNGTPAFRQLGQ